ncbi:MULTISPECIES: TolB family protein [Hyphobacterium]|uniref:TolB family protein n=1 Tax=Hyphobacterium vulgare TaxID=1736751 RepID=A0ABV6ZY47_9PROT
MYTIASTATILALFLSETASAQFGHPQFSPDGSQLTYFGWDLDSGTSEIFLMDMSSHEAIGVNLEFAWAANPVWMPDGRSIVFVGSEVGMRGNWDIFEVSLDGRNASSVYASDARTAHPHISPDGAFLAIVEMGPHADILLIELETGTSTQLTNTPSQEFHAKWSYDGQWVAFDQTATDGGTSIELVSPATGETRTLVEAAADRRVGSPAPTPAGSWLYSVQGPGGSALRMVDDQNDVLVFDAPAGHVVSASSWRPGTNEVAITLSSIDDNGDSWVGIVLLDTSTGALNWLAR